MSRFFLGVRADAQGADALSATQIRWLGALLARRPAAAGAALADLGRGARPRSGRAALRAAAARPRGAARRRRAFRRGRLRCFAVVVALTIRRHLRLFRRPRAVRRVPVRPVGIKFLEARVRARRHAARLPRVLPADHAVLLQPVAARRGRRGAGGAAARRRARRARAYAGDALRPRQAGARRSRAPRR